MTNPHDQYLSKVEAAGTYEVLGAADTSVDAHEQTYPHDQFARRTDSINVFSDVSTASPAPVDGQALVWSSGQWKPGDVAASGSGFLQVQDLSIVPLDTEPGTVIVVSDAAPVVPWVAGYSQNYYSPASTSTAYTFDLTKPAGLADGDVLLAVIGIQSSVQTVDLTPPAGFTRVNFPFVNPTGSDFRYLGFWRKDVVSAAGEPAAYTFGFPNAGTATRFNVALLAVRGAGAVTAFTPRTTVKDLTSQGVPSAAVASDGSLAVLAVTRNLGAGSDPSLAGVPAGWRLLFDDVGGVDYGSASTTQLAVMVKTMLPAGSVGGQVIGYKVAATNGTIASVVLGPSA